MPWRSGACGVIGPELTRLRAGSCRPESGLRSSRVSMRRWRPRGELEKLAAANEIFAAHLELAADPMLMENVAEKIAEE